MQAHRERKQKEKIRERNVLSLNKVKSYLFMSNEEAIGMFVFTSDLVIRQQVSELLNEADNLRNIIQRNTVLFDKVCLQQTF